MKVETQNDYLFNYPRRPITGGREYYTDFMYDWEKTYARLDIIWPGKTNDRELSIAN